MLERAAIKRAFQTDLTADRLHVAVIVMAVVVMAVVVMAVVVIVVTGILRLVSAMGGFGRLKTKHQGWINLPLADGQSACPWTQTRLDPLQHAVQLGRLQTIGTADQHQIRCLKLVLEQIFDGGEVIEALILLPLTFQGLGIANGTAATEGFAIHHRDNPIHVHTATDGWPLKSLEQGTGKGQTTRFNDNPIELIRSL